jgi:hypothetical protein
MMGGLVTRAPHKTKDQENIICLIKWTRKKSPETSILSFRRRGCVVINKNAIKAVIPAKAGIQNLLKILNSVSRFACSE